MKIINTLQMSTKKKKKKWEGGRKEGRKIWKKEKKYDSPYWFNVSGSNTHKRTGSRGEDRYEERERGEAESKKDIDCFGGNVSDGDEADNCKTWN